MLNLKYIKIKENFMSVVNVINRSKPSSSKGIYLRKVTISNTMGPGINIDTGDIKESLKGFNAAA